MLRERRASHGRVRVPILLPSACGRQVAPQRRKWFGSGVEPRAVARCRTVSHGGESWRAGGRKEPLRSSIALGRVPGGERVAARVWERSTRARAALPGEFARAFRVTLALDADGSVGRVDFVDAEGAPVTRSVRGASCDEVASGIALVTALAIDARTEPGVSDATPAASPPARATPIMAPAPLAASPPTRPVTTSAPSRAQLTAGIGGGYVGWLGPGGGVGVDVFVAAALSERGPALRLSGLHVLASGSAGARAARFRAWGGRVDVCPLTAVTGVFFFQPCGGVDFGSLQASGVKSAALRTEGREAALDALLIGRLGCGLRGAAVARAPGELARRS